MTAPTLERPDTVADPSPPTRDRLLTRAEAAQLLSVSERTIDRLATAGRLTRRKVPGVRMTRFSEAEVRALAAQGEG